MAYMRPTKKNQDGFIDGVWSVLERGLCGMLGLALCFIAAWIVIEALDDWKPNDNCRNALRIGVGVFVGLVAPRLVGFAMKPNSNA